MRANAGVRLRFPDQERWHGALAAGADLVVTTGARERGPSDFPIRTYRVFAEGDATFVEVPT